MIAEALSSQKILIHWFNTLYCQSKPCRKTRFSLGVSFYSFHPCQKPVGDSQEAGEFGAIRFRQQKWRSNSSNRLPQKYPSVCSCSDWVVFRWEEADVECSADPNTEMCKGALLHPWEGAGEPKLPISTCPLITITLLFSEINLFFDTWCDKFHVLCWIRTGLAEHPL